MAKFSLWIGAGVTLGALLSWMAAGCSSGGSTGAAGSAAGGSASGNPAVSGGGSSLGGSSGASGSVVAGSGGASGQVHLVVPPASDAGADSASGAGGAPASNCNVAILGQPGSLGHSVFSTWLSARGPQVKRFFPESGLTAAELAKYDVILLDWILANDPVGITPTQLAQWVERGGSLIALSGYENTNEVFVGSNRLMSELGVQFVRPQVGGVDSVVDGPLIDLAAHPICSGLNSGRSGYSGISYFGGEYVKGQPGDSIVMTLRGETVAVAATRGSGRLFVFGDEWIEFDSEWAQVPEIQTLWVNIFDWLGDCKLTPIPVVLQ